MKYRESRTVVMEFMVTELEKEVIKRAADILDISAATFIRNAVLAQALPMEECQKVVRRKRACLASEKIEG